MVMPAARGPSASPRPACSPVSTLTSCSGDGPPKITATSGTVGWFLRSGNWWDPGRRWGGPARRATCQGYSSTMAHPATWAILPVHAGRIRPTPCDGWPQRPSAARTRRSAWRSLRLPAGARAWRRRSVFSFSRFSARNGFGGSSPRTVGQSPGTRCNCSAIDPLSRSLIGHGQVLSDDLVVPVGEDGRRRVEVADDAQSARSRVGHRHLEIGTPVAKGEDQPPDVTGPEVGDPFPRRARLVDGQAVMDEDGGQSVGCPLEVDEIAEGEFEVVHAVDEGQIEGQTAEQGAEIVGGEEVVAGEAEDAGLPPHREARLRFGIDADAIGAREGAGHRTPCRYTDLDVGAGKEMLVDTVEQIQILGARLVAPPVGPVDQIHWCMVSGGPAHPLGRSRSEPVITGGLRFP